LAELGGALAVFATLVYLARQIRQSNQLAMAQHRETNRITMLDISEPLIRDPEFAALLHQTAESVEGVSESDLRRVRLHIQNELLAAQSLFVRGRLMDEERMERVSGSLAANIISRHSLAQELWQGTEYDAAFVAHVESLLERRTQQ